MHNLSYRQIALIGAAIVFGIPAVVGIVLGHFHGLGGGIFSALLVFVWILAIVGAKLRAVTKEQKNKPGDKNEINK